MENKKIGIIGVGGIANSVHIPGIEKCSGAEIYAICDINKDTLKSVGDRLGIPENLRFCDYRELIGCPKVDAVEICTPNYLHVEMALAAAAAKKPFNVEKPLSISMDTAIALEEKMKSDFVPNMMCFSYRFKPAVRYAKWILERGMIGDIVNVNVEYLKSSAFWEGRRLDWRFVKEYAGTGVLGDLGVHLIDMAEFLLGNIKEVSATTEIFVKNRKKLDSEEIGEVTTDDYCSFLANFENNIKGTFLITRCALGHANTIKYDIYGTKGVISFDLDHPEVLGVCVGEVDRMSEALHTVNVPHRFYVEQEQTFADMINGKECEYLPTLKDGFRSQRILDALLLSDSERKWISI